ncbi:hypothetical protein SNUCP2_08970 [Clostridium perfringens A]
MEFKIKRVFGGRLILNNYCIKMLFLFYIKLVYLKRLRKNRTFFYIIKVNIIIKLNIYYTRRKNSELFRKSYLDDIWWIF